MNERMPTTESRKELYLIWTWLHGGTFWRDNRAGYTDDINQAGCYTEQEALDICNEGFPGSKIMLGPTYNRLLIGKTKEEIIKALILWRTL
jgi:hypothetical protein